MFHFFLTLVWPISRHEHTTHFSCKHLYSNLHQHLEPHHLILHQLSCVSYVFLFNSNNVELLCQIKIQCNLVLALLDLNLHQLSCCLKACILNRLTSNYLVRHKDQLQLRLFAKNCIFY